MRPAEGGRDDGDARAPLLLPSPQWASTSGGDNESELSFAGGRPAGRSCMGTPRLRRDWDHLEAECVLSSHATIWETLWVVIFTMAVAKMRDEELKRGHDWEW